MEFYILFALYPRRSLPDDASAKLVRKRRSKWKKFLMSLPNGIKSVLSRNHYYRSMTFPTTDDNSRRSPSAGEPERKVDQHAQFAGHTDG